MLIKFSKIKLIVLITLYFNTKWALKRDCSVHKNVIRLFRILISNRTSAIHFCGTYTDTVTFWVLKQNCPGSNCLEPILFETHLSKSNLYGTHLSGNHNELYCNATQNRHCIYLFFFLFVSFFKIIIYQNSFISYQDNNILYKNFHCTIYLLFSAE